MSDRVLIVVSLFLSVATATALGCVDSIGVESAPAGVATEPVPIEIIGPLGDPGRAIAIDGAGGVLVVWPLALGADDRLYENVSGFMTTPERIVVDVDDDGLPRSLIPMLPADGQDAEAIEDGAVASLAAVGGFASPGDATYIFFEKQARFVDGRSSVFGSGVCQLAASTGPCERLPAFEGGPSTFAFNRGGFAADDGFAYLPRCEGIGALEARCILGRVPIASTTDPDAYQFFSGFTGWVDSAREATAISDVVGELSLKRSRTFGGYYLTTMSVFDGDVSIRRAERPEGPYGLVNTITELDLEDTFASGPLEVTSLPADASLSDDSKLFLVQSGVTPLSLVSFRFFDEAR